MGALAAGKPVTVESVNSQNSEPAPNLPPRFCERISPTAVVLDCGAQTRRQRGPDRYCAIYGLKYFASPMF
jgi:hypothetical protein